MSRSDTISSGIPFSRITCLVNNSANIGAVLVSCVGINHIRLENRSTIANAAVYSFLKCVSVSLNFYGRTGILRPRVVYARTLFLPVSPISVRAVPGTEFSALRGNATGNATSVLENDG